MIQTTKTQEHEFEHGKIVLTLGLETWKDPLIDIDQVAASVTGYAKISATGLTEHLPATLSPGTNPDPINRDAVIGVDGMTAKFTVVVEHDGQVEAQLLVTIAGEILSHGAYLTLDYLTGTVPAQLGGEVVLLNHASARGWHLADIDPVFEGYFGGRGSLGPYDLDDYLGSHTGNVLGLDALRDMRSGSEFLRRRREFGPPGPLHFDDRTHRRVLEGGGGSGG